MVGLDSSKKSVSLKKTYKKSSQGGDHSRFKQTHTICNMQPSLDSWFLKKCYERHLGDDLEIFSGKCAVYGVAQIWTWLKWLSSSSPTCYFCFKNVLSVHLFLYHIALFISLSELSKMCSCFSWSLTWFVCWWISLTFCGVCLLFFLFSVRTGTSSISFPTLSLMLTYWCPPETFAGRLTSLLKADREYKGRKWLFSPLKTWTLHWAWMSEICAQISRP